MTRGRLCPKWGQFDSVWLHVGSGVSFLFWPARTEHNSLRGGGAGSEVLGIEQFQGSIQFKRFGLNLLKKSKK